ncbi:oxidoreductase [Actinorhabdospora filicis]|uniref:Oxidoreductase n=1 Tax=Actinorhabdospora filicis TaxID=1785913 RepID=A0A9W6SN70_9ACTN|nr:FAD-dependent oxidoreductase [Actinorhabdospora filicis]GLZ79293.1 oxidoreductase [Actinorhabdospora filicis]
MRNIIVLGAGYAGLGVATRLARQVDAGEVRVTLVNGRDHFVQRPRLHQAAAGQKPDAPGLAGLFGGPAAELRIGWARAVDTAAKVVSVSTADAVEDLPYDTLVYALGSHVDTTAVPGIAEHAVVLEAGGARVPETGTVIVCGGGLTGIEAACEFAETHPALTVKLVSRGEPGAWLSEGARKHIAKAFARLGVEVVRGEVTAVEAGRLVLADGELAFDACVWAGGFAVGSLAAEAGLTVDARGLAVVDAHLRSVSHPDVYVIGDAAAVTGRDGSVLAMGCRVGAFQGPYVADAIVAAMLGKDHAPFTYRYIHQCVSLGRRDAVIQFVHAEDETPRNAVLRGKVAVWYKELVLNGGLWAHRNPGPYGPHRKVRPAVTAR